MAVVRGLLTTVDTPGQNPGPAINSAKQNLELEQAIEKLVGEEGLEPSKPYGG